MKTIEAMGIDAMVVRHRCAGAPHRVAEWIDASVINAGDGRHEHPTQALLDAFTLRRHRGRPRRVPHRDRRRHPQLAGRAAARCSAFTARRRGHVRRPADAAARAARRLAGDRRRTTSTTCSASSTSSTCCGCSRSASARRCSRACASTTRCDGLTAERAGADEARHARDAPGPDDPRRRSRPRSSTGRGRSCASRSRTASRCAWPCSGHSSDREDKLPDAAARPRRSCASTRPASASPTCWCATA